MDLKVTDQAVRDWLDTASAADITLALRIGAAAIGAARPKPARVAAETGKNGEKRVLAALSAHFGAAINTSAAPHQGDIALFSGGNKIMVEVKNYSSAVPAAEIAKFVRDLDTAAAHGGVLVSLGAPIAGVNGSLVTKFEQTARGAVPCVYIVSDDPEMIVGAARICAKMAALSRESAEISADFGQVLAAGGALAAARAEILAATGEISRRLMAASTGIARCEVAVGAIAANHGVTEDPFSGDLKFIKYQPELQAAVRAVAKLLAPESLWKVSRGKVTTAAGTIILYAARAIVALPRVNCLISAAAAALGDDFGLDSDSFLLNITAATAPWIEKNYALVSAATPPTV